MTYTCNHCGWHGEEPTLRDKGMHLGAYCPFCEKWIKWVPQRSKGDDLPRIIYLQWIDDDGVVLEDQTWSDERVHKYDVKYKKV